ncbi:MAG: hypothetical protein AAF591_23330, partial [Verrucomicrobiota bacterium]
MNPFLLMKNNYLLSVLSLFVLAGSPWCSAEEVALYDNTHLEAKKPPFVPASAPAPFYLSETTHIAFQFYTWDSDNVSSLSITMMRTGTPGGTLFFEVWSTGSDNLPGTKVGELGTFSTDDLPLWEGNDVPPPSPVKVEGSVTGLQSMTRYYAVIRIGDDVDVTGRNQTIHTGALFPGSHSWAGPGTANPPEGEPLHELVSQANNDGRWPTLTEDIGAPPGAWQHARITAACPARTVIHYDTLNHGHEGLNRPNRSTKLSLDQGDAGARDAQPFVAPGDTVTSVTLGLVVYDRS